MARSYVGGEPRGGGESRRSRSGRSWQTDAREELVARAAAGERPSPSATARVWARQAEGKESDGFG